MSPASTVPGVDVAMIPGPTRFGVFIAPYHDPAGNPSVQIRRDLDLVKLLDEGKRERAEVGKAIHLALPPRATLLARRRRRVRRVVHHVRPLLQLRMNLRGLAGRRRG